MKFREVRQTVLTDAMKVARAKERLEVAIAELQKTVKYLEDILEGGASSDGQRRLDR